MAKAKPAWAWPALVLMAIVWCSALAHYSYQNGYRIGKDETEAVYDSVDQSMKDMGFCEWTRKARFQQKCWPQERMPKTATHPEKGG